MARVAESHGARLTHLTLANNKYTALPQILSSIAVISLYLYYVNYCVSIAIQFFKLPLCDRMAVFSNKLR